jgi:hypothetical protein
MKINDEIIFIRTKLQKSLEMPVYEFSTCMSEYAQNV